MAEDITGVFIAAFFAALTIYIAWKEKQRWGDLSRLAEYDKRIALIESDLCTKEDVRRIVKDESESLIIALREQNVKIDQMVAALHDLALNFAKRRETFSGD